MADVSSQLATLRALRDAATDPAQRAALDTAIAAIAGQAPDAQPGQHIGDEANVGAAVGRDVHGDVQTGGTRNEALIQIFLSAAGVTQATEDQRELVADYLDGLARRCDQLRLRGVVDWERKRGKAPDFTLSQVYIALAATSWVTLREGDADALQPELTGHDPDEVLPLVALRVAPSLGTDGATAPGHRRAHGRGMEVADRTAALQRPLLLTEELSQRRRLVLLGGPGSGKSTFLRHLAVALARSADATPKIPGWTAGPLLPVYASLGGFAAWLQQERANPDAGALWRYLTTLSEHETLAGLGDALRRAFRRGRLLLLLDGLDEVADPALRVAVSRAVAALADRHEAFVAVTCRVRSFADDVAAPLADWGEPAQLAPFTLGQIKHFVRGWYAGSVARGAFGDREAEQRAEALIGRFVALDTLRDLGAIPLLLTIITILHYYEGKLPEDRADLYEDMVQLLLTRWTQQRREAGVAQSLLERLVIPALKETQLRQTLTALAYRAHQGERSADGRGLLEQATVREAFTGLFTGLGLAPGVAYEKALTVLTYLEDESGLLLHEGGERYAFPHLTYEEYLAGTHLVAQDSAVRPLAFQQRAYDHWRADPTRWREVILLALGHAVRLPRLETVALWLQFLVNPHHGARPRDAAELQHAALFAAEGLADIGGPGQLASVSTVDLPALWDRLAGLLAEAVAGAHLVAADRIRAGFYLGELGDPRPGVCDLPPAMVPIVGGSFQIGITEDEYRQLIEQERANKLADEAKAWYGECVNQQAVVVVSFDLARYPLTNTQYKLFMDAGGYDPAASWWNSGADWLRRTGVVAPRYWADDRLGILRPNHPVVGISWYEAMAFCVWLTGHLDDGYVYRLPSEAEWEYVARGGTRQMHPWGAEAPEAERAIYGDVSDGTTAVGCFPRGATPGTELLDMAGNVWEWTRSEYKPYPYIATDGREEVRDLANKMYILRGGSWGDLLFSLRAVYRLFVTPDARNNQYGVRLARHRKV